MGQPQHRDNVRRVDFTAKASTSDEEDAEKDESPVPGIDIGLEEGWRILQDLVGLTSKRSGLAQKP